MTQTRILPCEWEEIHPFVERYLKDNRITVESFWEDHVMESNYYKVMCDDQMAGYFAIQDEETLVLFHIFDQYSDQSQALFARAKVYENVTNAMVATGDEYFLSHCIDSFSRIEKQAYFSIYTEKDIPVERQKKLSLRLADVEADLDTLKLSGDFLDGEIDKLREGVEHLQVYIVTCEGETIGFGVVEYGRVVRDIASIGMYVREQYRRQGFAANILRELKALVQGKGYRAFSGCWYYNHNSKKSMESAGAYSKSRLIRFYF